MNQKENTLKSLTDRLRAFKPQTFGIMKRDEDGPPILHVERCMFRISYMRILIAGQGRKVQFQENDFPSDYRLLMDGYGEEPAKARLALTQGPNDIIVATGDMTPISGSVFLVADMADDQFFAISALFSADASQQLSSILCDTSKELLLHWSLQNKLMVMEKQYYG